jgi:hypothetical protein
MGRPQEWLDIPLWDDYQIHPDSRVRRGTYVLKQFTKAGIARVHIDKELPKYRQLFSMPVWMLMRWARVEDRRLLCGENTADDLHDVRLGKLFAHAQSGRHGDTTLLRNRIDNRRAKLRLHHCQRAGSDVADYGHPRRTRGHQYADADVWRVWGPCCWLIQAARPG